MSSLLIDPNDLVVKGPKNKQQQQQQQQSKSESSLRHTAHTPKSTVGISAAAMQQTSSTLVSPVTQVWSPEYPAYPQLSQQQDDQLGLEVLEELFGSNNVGVSNNGNAAPTNYYSTVVSSMPPPQPQPQQPSTQVLNGVSATIVSSGSRSGPPISPQTNRALKSMLSRGRTLQNMVDEQFNTPLHNAVLNQSKEDFDFLLVDLKSQKKLLPTINLLNSSGHTPLSLCLKYRRADLIPLLLDYDAAPTQLCGGASERTNHFHYAMCKCLDSLETLSVVQTLIFNVIRHCSTDLLGVLAKNRHGKTAVDCLRHRMLQLSSHQDAANADLYAALQNLLHLINEEIVKLRREH